ncbi:MAG: RidA family protein [Chloroflexota bacterium]
MERKSYPFYYGNVKQSVAKAVVANGFVFLTGVSGREFATGKVKAMNVRVQTETAWSKIKSVLEEAGTSLDNIVKVVIYLRDVKNYDDYTKATERFLKKESPYLLDNPPANTLVEAGLLMPEILVEIEVTAVMP